MLEGTEQGNVSVCYLSCPGVKGMVSVDLWTRKGFVLIVGMLLSKFPGKILSKGCMFLIFMKKYYVIFSLPSV